MTSISGRFARLFAAAAAFGMVAAGAAQAQEWPKGGTITMVLPYGPGGADSAARVFADALTKQLGQQVIVENRGGAGGTIGTGSFVNGARPDGYTFLMTGPSPIVNAPQLYKTLPYDPTKLVPISMMFSTPIMVVVNAEFASSVTEIIEKAKANPGQVAASDIGNGSTYQLLHMMFEDAAGVQLNKVSYSATSQAQVDILANRVNMVLDYPAVWGPHAKEGKVKILANLDTERAKDYPDVPTIAEAGLPNYPAWLGWYAVFGPEGLPADIQQKMNAAMTAALQDPVVVEKFALQNYTPTPSAPEAVTERMTLETEILAKIVKERNLSLEQ